MVSELYEAIYALVRQIPRGNVSTYGDIARIVATNPRVVGYALHRNPSSAITPCHRVVFKNGALTPGYIFGGLDAQRKMLQQEGLRFSETGTVLSEYFWVPPSKMI